MTIAIASILPQLQRAQLLHQQGRTGEAWTVLAPLRSAIDGHGQALRLYALVAQAAGQVDESLRALERVGVLEKDPADTVGAMADMLGQLGRHDDALPLWDKLVARHPEMADAHLNRAVNAASAGRNDLAVAAADEGLKRFPGHPRLLATRAMALKNAGRVDEAVEAFELAVAADPGRALTRHNHAVALRAACRYVEACEAYAASERLGMTGAQFHANWAAAALEAGQLELADEQYRKALAAEPGHKEALEGLARLQIEYRGGTQAFDHYEESVRRRGSEVAAWLEWANALIAHYRRSEAAEVAERGLREHPDEPALLAMAAFANGMAGDAAAALQEIAGTYGDRADAPFSWMAELALRAGQPEEAANYAQRVIARDQLDQGAWSVLTIAWRLLDDPREHWLCDYDRLVMTTEVVPPDGGMNAEEYARTVAAALDPLHLARSAPGDQTLRGGTQTSGALFARPDAEIQRFRSAVLDAAAKAIAALPDDPAHPFLRRKTRQLDFSGSWSVRLRSGGFHIPHFHGRGWMSSAFYARLPAASAAARERHEGWIQFGQPPDDYGLAIGPRKLVEPKPGRLVLFPSYMWHGTVPFEGEDRLTAAFDYIPAPPTPSCGTH